MQDVRVDRDKYIGGSDIGVIMGISPFKSRFDLLLEKAGYKKDEFEGNEFTRYGNCLEPKIRDYINSLGFTSKKYREDKKIVDDIRCHVDGYNGETVLEIKTTSKIHDNVDDYKLYLVQLLFYMQYMKTNKGLLAVYNRPDDFDDDFQPSRLNLYYIDIDNYKELLLQINNAVEQFRIDLKKVKENPFITEEDLLPVNITELSNKLVEVENQLVAFDELTKRQKELKVQLKNAMEINNIKKWTTNTGIQVTLVLDSPDKEVMKFNETKFKDENASLYENYLEKKIQKGKAGYVKITMPKKENNYE